MWREFIIISTAVTNSTHKLHQQWRQKNSCICIFCSFFFSPSLAHTHRERERGENLFFFSYFFLYTLTILKWQRSTHWVLSTWDRPQCILILRSTSQKPTIKIANILYKYDLVVGLTHYTHTHTPFYRIHCWQLIVKKSYLSFILSLLHA